MNKIPYIVAALDYRHNSSGIRILHLLCKMLNEKGYEAYTNVKVTIKGAPTLYGNEPKLRKLIIDGAIVVYPECFQVNFLWSKHPVGWLLNAGEYQFEREGLVFAYVKNYREGVPTFSIIDTEEFFTNDKNYERKYNAVYVGKGTSDERMNTIPNRVIITHQFPKKRKQLADLLKRTKTLYTYDSRTAVNQEAELCGCKVELFENGKNTQEDFSKALWIDPKNNSAEVDKFIQITQNWAKEN